MGTPHLLHPQASLAAPGGVELCRGPGAQGFPTLSLAVRTGASPGSSSHGPTCPSYGSGPPGPPGSAKDGDPPGRQPPPLASLWAPWGQPLPGRGRAQRRGHEAGLGLRTDGDDLGSSRDREPRLVTPGQAATGGRGEAETMQRVDRWAGNPRPRRGQPPAWARGPHSHLWKRGCSPSLTEKSARPEPLIVREGGPLQRHTSPTCAPHRGRGQHSKQESGGRLRNPPTPPSRLLPGTGPGDRARGREPPRLPGADGRGGHASSCHSGLRPGKAVPCGVQRRAALTGRGWQHIS